MTAHRIKGLASLSFFGLLLMPNAVRTQEVGDRLVVHIRSAAVTLNHVSLKNEGFGQEVATSLQKIEGVIRTRALPTSGMVEARLDANKTTGERVADTAKKILEEKLAGRKIEAQNLLSHNASSKILVKSVSGNQVQVTSERFY